MYFTSVTPQLIFTGLENSFMVFVIRGPILCHKVLLWFIPKNVFQFWILIWTTYSMNSYVLFIILNTVNFA